MCKHDEYINQNNTKCNIEAHMHIQKYKEQAYMAWVDCQGGASRTTVTKIPLCTNPSASGSRYALQQRLPALLSLLHFYVSRVEQRAASERIRTKRNESAENI